MSFKLSSQMLEFQAPEHRKRKIPGAVRHSVVLAMEKDEAIVPVSQLQPCSCKAMQQEAYKCCFGGKC